MLAQHCKGVSYTYFLYSHPISFLLVIPSPHVFLVSIQLEAHTSTGCRYASGLGHADSCEQSIMEWWLIEGLFIFTNVSDFSFLFLKLSTPVQPSETMRNESTPCSIGPTTARRLVTTHFIAIWLTDTQCDWCHGAIYRSKVVSFKIGCTHDFCSEVAANGLSMRTAEQHVQRTPSWCLDVIDLFILGDVRQKGLRKNSGEVVLQREMLRVKSRAGEVITTLANGFMMRGHMTGLGTLNLQTQA
ncbi:hypothetical protein FB567DRAFT_236331 [Paraphoma chrysanthemicola]|uniref:Uncharacterized protein n=1 Tax=Paraphoma chrysanthemicola TaxID=798071 RepID=A0A8K0RGI9_9PLEO|nr:hypothetical protein FB567DRAFT_236331 [Paraphoma chrysanthemicola]